MTLKLYCNDPVCPDCGEEPVLLSCHHCGVRGMVTDCGHLDRPRPLDTSLGVDWPVIVCHHCERQQEQIVSLIQAVMPANTRGDVLTLYRRAVNIALRRGPVEPGRPKFDDEHQAVAYIWNGGLYEEAIQSMLSLEESG